MRGIFYIDNERCLSECRILIKELKAFQVNVRIEELNLINEFNSESVESSVDFALFICASSNLGSQQRTLNYLNRIENHVALSIYFLTTESDNYTLHSLKGSKSNIFSTSKNTDSLVTISRIIYSTESQGLLSSVGFENLIKREIEFPPHFKQAGINILSHFAEILDKKYPEMESKVRITQSGKKVILEIDTPRGYRKIAEEELDLYGQVIVGNLATEDYMSSPSDVAWLNNQFFLFNEQIKHQNRLLGDEKRSEIRELRQEKNNLLSLVEQCLSHQQRIIETQSETIQIQLKKEDLAESLKNLLEFNSTSSTEKDKNEILEQLVKFQKKDKKGFKKFVDTSVSFLSKTGQSLLVEVLTKISTGA